MKNFWDYADAKAVVRRLGDGANLYGILVYYVPVSFGVTTLVSYMAAQLFK